MILFNLLKKTNNKIISFIMLFLFLSLSVGFATSMVLESLTDSYKKYLFESYTGKFGTVFFILKGNSTKNDKFLFKLQKEINGPSIIYSKSDVEFKFNGYTKKVTLIVWNNKEYVNNVLDNLIGHQFILNDKIKLDLKVIDTGFLNNYPMIFLNKNRLNILGIKKKFNILAVNVDIDNIENIKKKIQAYADKFQIEYKLDDIITHNKEILLQIHSIKYFQYVLYFMTLILSSIIIIFTLNIFLNVKKRAIYVIRVYGLSATHISLFFAFIGFLIMFVSTLLGNILFKLFQNSFIIPLLDVNINFYFLIDVFLAIFIFILFKIKLKRIEK